MTKSISFLFALALLLVATTNAQQAKDALVRGARGPGAKVLSDVDGVGDIVADPSRGTRRLKKTTTTGTSTSKSSKSGPTASPSVSLAPSRAPSGAPSGAPSISAAPSRAPSGAPSGSPSISMAPSLSQAPSQCGKGSCDNIASSGRRKNRALNSRKSVA